MNSSESKSLVVIGGGGHASVLVDILRSQQREILAIVSPENISQRRIFSGITHLKNDDDILRFSPDSVNLVNGVGMLPKSGLKRKLNEYFLSLGYTFETVISDSAQVSSFAEIEQGAQVFSGAIIQAGVVIDAHTIINSGVIIEHDCHIGEYNHIAPKATLCGQVTTHSNVYVGANATVIQNITLEQGSIVGAGAIVTKNISSEQICYPSRSVLK
ncbi:sialic acid biosynthesis protein NeuD [Aliivibrio fischeri ES114]|uniref:Sialic acid biosynthesis protein NeuD n=1 Tax=Aliivibrio fischeri (strain ATCC 700601 / ES114) TaxID=312309 RepID=Q5E8K7_ALIF1|nr:acetyltransferase [Aliivibrio fischeri]AAW84639.1 sialic acid biosynthesis protein NeuD [Aliivibrio fischeri ES114]KLU78907.1 shikimate dehydrogenase [Aliivibrio fischeri]